MVGDGVIETPISRLILGNVGGIHMFARNFLMAVLLLTSAPAVGQSIDADTLLKLGISLLQKGASDQAPTNKQATSTNASQQSSTIKHVQQRLAQLGYDPGLLDGVMGARTSEAIRQFEISQGMSPTGTITPTLISILDSQPNSNAAAETVKPSFNCAKARTLVEHAICNSADLARLDQALADAYRAQSATLNSQGRTSLKAQQKNWLASRDSCGSDATCLAQSISSRIAVLGGTLPPQSIVAQDSVTARVAPAMDGQDQATDALEAASAKPALLDQLEGLFLVDDLPAIFNGAYYSTPAGLDRQSFENQTIPALTKLIDRVGLLPDDPRFAKGKLPYWGGDLLGSDVLTSLAKQATNGAFGRRFPPENKIGRFSYTEIVLNWMPNDFARKRLETMIKERVAAELPKLRITSPLKVRFYCPLFLARNPETGAPQYDFDKGYFEVDEFDKYCGTLNGKTLGRNPWPAFSETNRGGRFSANVETGDQPARIVLPADMAERFVEISGEQKIDIGFDAELSARLGTAKNGEPVSVYTLRRTGDYALYYHVQPQSEIYHFKEGQLEPEPLTPEEKRARQLADFDRIWDFTGTEEHQVLLDMADDAGSFSSDLFTGPTKLTFSVRASSGSKEALLSPNPENGLSDMLKYGWARDAASFLRRPPTSVFDANFGLVGSHRSPLAKVYVALPDRLESYKRPAPPPGAYVRLSVEFELKSAWKLPSAETKPEILLFAVPVKGVYLPAEHYGNEPAQPIAEFRFDSMPVAEFTSYDIARPRDIVAAAAKRTGGDAAEMLASVFPSTSLSAIEKRDQIAELLAMSVAIDLNDFWMSGYGDVADYDFETGTAGFKYIVLTYPDGLPFNEDHIRRPDLLRLTNLGKGGTLRFPMNEEGARRLRDADQGPDPKLRIRLVAEPSSNTLPLHVRIAEISVLKRNADPTVNVGSDIIEHIVLPMPQAADETVPPADPRGLYDILGVTIRSPLAKAQKIVETEFSPETIAYGRRTRWTEDPALSSQITPTSPLLENISFVRNGGTDLLTLFHEPYLADDPVTGIARSIAFAESARPDPDSVIGALKEKYGNPDKEGAFGFAWYEKIPLPEVKDDGEMSMEERIAMHGQRQIARTYASTCANLLGSSRMALEFAAQRALQNGMTAFEKSYPMVDRDGQDVSPPALNPFWAVGAFDINQTARCNEDVALAVLEKDSNGLVSVLRILVTNRKYLNDIEVAAEAARVEDRATHSKPGAIPKL